MKEVLSIVLFRTNEQSPSTVTLSHQVEQVGIIFSLLLKNVNITLDPTHVSKGKTDPSSTPKCRIVMLFEQH